MRMVASAKLHHTQGMTEAFLRYKDKLQEIVESLQLTVDSSKRADDQQGDSQLSTINYQLSTLLKTNREFHADFIPMLEQIEKNNTFTGVSTLVEQAFEWYQNQEIDSVEFLYHHFKSMGTQVIQVDSLQLTVDSSMKSEGQQSGSQLSTLNSQLSTYLTEPSREELLASLFPRLLNAQVYGILLDSLTSEHAARMLAMQTADDNANDLLKELTLVYNKTRQQAITNELIDIMGGQSGKH